MPYSLGIKTYKGKKPNKQNQTIFGGNTVQIWNLEKFKSKQQGFFTERFSLSVSLQALSSNAISEIVFSTEHYIIMYFLVSYAYYTLIV